MPASGTISFNQIPANIRNPLFYAEVSNAAAGYYQDNGRVLIIGQTTSAITEGAPVLVPSADFVKATYGSGSQLDVAVSAFRTNNQFTELWVLPLLDAAGSAAATATVTITGTPTASGTISLYVGDDLVQAGVLTTDTVTTAAVSVVAAINANKNLPVTATNAAGVVTITAKNKGTLGNSLPLTLNFRGNIANEAVPAGLNVALTAFTGGATDPLLSAKLPLIGAQDFAFYGHPYADATNLDSMRDFLAARWNALVGQDGHAFTTKSGTVSSLTTLGLTRNDENHTIVGYESTSPSSPVEVLGAYLGQASFSLLVDPARTLQTLVLTGTTAPKESDRFSLANRSTLLNSGIATLFYASGSPAIERAITTYQKNSYGQADASYLDVTTRVTLSYIKKSVKYKITQKYPRHKLAADGTIFGAGNAIVTPKDVRAELLAWYDELQFLGIVQNPKGFEASLLVTLNATDPNRLDILLPPTIVNNLVVAAVKVEFRLNA